MKFTFCLHDSLCRKAYGIYKLTRIDKFRKVA